MNSWTVINTLTLALQKKGYKVDVVLAEQLHKDEVQVRLRIKDGYGRTTEFTTEEL